MIRRIINSVIEGTIQNPHESLIYSHPFTKTDTSHFKWLSSVAPCFPVSSKNVQIITEPKQFYETLIQYCTTASERITLVSLYLGVGELENKLVTALKTNQHFKDKKLKVNILLDYVRGSRDKQNSRTVLQPLLQSNETNCTVSLYHTPHLRGLLKKYMPNRFNEIVGLQHMKLYIFDDTIIISGANLSNDYFTNRQDRYFVIQDRKLTDFYCGLVQRVQNFSLKMDKDDRISLSANCKACPYKGNKNNFIEYAGDLIEQYLEDSRREQNTIQFQGCDTWIFPTVQMGQLGIEHDSYVTEKILAEAPRNSYLKIATGYFNLTSQYMNTLIYDTQANCEILMAHPKANGFLGAKGIAGGIPYAYSLIAKKFKELYEKKNQGTRIRLFEYLKNGWTYHAKGLWYYPPNSQFPCMTIIGSPNFGERSVVRDLETQLVIVTENTELQEHLHNECIQLYNRSQIAHTERKIPLWINIFVFLFRSYF
ncbi:phosphatidylglycerophosphate synthase 1 [Rhynchophorus ferrugineus]|uniref:phosphatidylglycerophosphate synthase 1 n=1 Tax=Rhynchophorus ferrugineus TaxID=354439 RepID=UPI003FCCF5DC